MSDETNAVENAEVVPRKKGRPSFGDKPMKSGIYIRCSEEQKNAIIKYVDGLNNSRKNEGLPRIDVSSWMRELALKYSGNEELGMAAQAAKMAKAFSI